MSLETFGNSLSSVDAATKSAVPSAISSLEPSQLMSNEPDTTRKMLGPESVMQCVCVCVIHEYTCACMFPHFSLVTRSLPVFHCCMLKNWEWSEDEVVRTTYQCFIQKGKGGTFLQVVCPPPPIDLVNKHNNYVSINI